jgi:hypothetical protein
VDTERMAIIPRYGTIPIAPLQTAISRQPEGDTTYGCEMDVDRFKELLVS